MSVYLSTFLHAYARRISSTSSQDRQRNVYFSCFLHVLVIDIKYAVRLFHKSRLCSSNKPITTRKWNYFSFVWKRWWVLSHQQNACRFGTHFCYVCVALEKKTAQQKISIRPDCAYVLPDCHQRNWFRFQEVDEFTSVTRLDFSATSAESIIK